MSIVERAREFAVQAHGDQKRKYTGEPYVAHTQEVASIVEAAGGDENMIAAAHLHDVIEDTAATYDDVRAAFGADVADLVRELSDQVPMSFGNRRVRKLAESDRFANADPRVQTIKLADIISNAPSIAERDPNFARVYLVEMRYLVSKLGRGNTKLLERARQIVDG